MVWRIEDTLKSYYCLFLSWRSLSMQKNHQTTYPHWTLYSMNNNNDLNEFYNWLQLNSLYIFTFISSASPNSIRMTLSHYLANLYSLLPYFRVDNFIFKQMNIIELIKSFPQSKILFLYIFKKKHDSKHWLPIEITSLSFDEKKKKTWAIRQLLI